MRVLSSILCLVLLISSFSGFSEGSIEESEVLFRELEPPEEENTWIRHMVDFGDESCYLWQSEIKHVEPQPSYNHTISCMNSVRSRMVVSFSTTSLGAHGLTVNSSHLILFNSNYGFLSISNQTYSEAFNYPNSTLILSINESSGSVERTASMNHTGEGVSGWNAIKKTRDDGYIVMVTEAAYERIGWKYNGSKPGTEWALHFYTLDADFNVLDSDYLLARNGWYYLRIPVLNGIANHITFWFNCRALYYMDDQTVTVENEQGELFDGCHWDRSFLGVYRQGEFTAAPVQSEDMKNLNADWRLIEGESRSELYLSNASEFSTRIKQMFNCTSNIESSPIVLRTDEMSCVMVPPFPTTPFRIGFLHEASNRTIFYSWGVELPADSGCGNCFKISIMDANWSFVSHISIQQLNGSDILYPITSDAEIFILGSWDRIWYYLDLNYSLNSSHPSEPVEESGEDFEGGTVIGNPPSNDSEPIVTEPDTSATSTSENTTETDIEFSPEEDLVPNWSGLFIVMSLFGFMLFISRWL